MMNVCTHAGLSNKDNRLLIPASTLEKPLPLMLGDGERESGDEGGESGGAGRRVFERVAFRELRPDSSM